MIYHLIDKLHRNMPHIDSLSYRSSVSLSNACESKKADSQAFEQVLWVSKKTIIDHAWRASDKAPMVFATRHLPHCDTCAVRFDESIEEAAEAYQIPLVEWLMALNFGITG